MILNEDNKSVADLLNFLEPKLEKLKQIGDKEVLKYANQIYSTVVLDWINENYLAQEEVSQKAEQELCDYLLDLISTIDNIIDTN